MITYSIHCCPCRMYGLLSMHLSCDDGKRTNKRYYSLTKKLSYKLSKQNLNNKNFHDTRYKSFFVFKHIIVDTRIKSNILGHQCQPLTLESHGSYTCIHSSVFELTVDVVRVERLPLHETLTSKRIFYDR